MDKILAFFVITTTTLYFIGRKKPEKSLFWFQGTRTKKLSNTIYGISTLLCFFLISFLLPDAKEKKENSINLTEIINSQKEHLAFLSDKESIKRDSLLKVLSQNKLYISLSDTTKYNDETLYLLNNICSSKLTRQVNSYAIGKEFAKECNNSKQLNEFAKTSLALLYYGGFDNTIMNAISWHINEYGYFGVASSKYDENGEIKHTISFNHSLISGVIEHESKNKFLLENYCKAIERGLIKLERGKNYINQQLINEDSFNKFLKFNYAECSCHKNYDKMFTEFKENCINDLYGSCGALERYTKERLKDPDSFEHISTSGIQEKDFTILTMKYRAKNSFNGFTIGIIKAKVNGDCEILKILLSN
jgi:hypothetical protein